MFKMIPLHGVYVLAFLGTVASECYVPGPAWPTVDRILDTENIAPIREKLDDLMGNLFLEPARWNSSTTSFAIQITTRTETVWNYYYTAPVLGEYTESKLSVVSGDTAFRIASVSKSFTAYATLLEKSIGLDDPVTKWIPELMEGEMGWTFVHWDQITVRSLMSQLGGVARGSE